MSKKVLKARRQALAIRDTAATNASTRTNPNPFTSPASSLRWKIYAPLLIAVLGFLIYSNTFNVIPRFDDTVFIFDRIQTRDIIRVWTEGDLYRKIPYLTFALNYLWTGQNIWGWSLVNILFHLATTLAVFGIANTIWRSKALADHPLRPHARSLSLFTALLFVCHPIQTSSVTYLYQRITVIAVLFHALALYGYLKARVDGKYLYWALAGGAGILACFTKQINMTLPLTIILTEAAFCSSSAGDYFKRGIRWLPLALVPAAIYLWVMNVDFSNFSPEKLRSLYPQNNNSWMTWGQWIPTQLNVMRTYLRLLVFPIHQALDYDYPTANGLGEPEVMISIILLTAVLGAGALCWKRRRLIAWGIFFMAATLSLEFLAVRETLFEHRLYLPMIGFSVAVPEFVYTVIPNKKAARAWMAAILAALSIAAFARNAVWADIELFFKNEMRLFPNKGRSWHSLGVYYASQGRYAEAIPYYIRSIELWPQMAEAYSNLGKALEETGRIKDATRFYAKSVEIDPTLANGLSNYGAMLVGQGKTAKARRMYTEAIRRKPDNYLAMSNMGASYAKDGKWVEAADWHRKSIATNPLYAVAYYNLGDCLGSLKDFPGAEKNYLEALRLQPNLFEAHNNLAQLYVWQERYDEAITAYTELIQMRPDYAEAHETLGSLLAQKKQFADAEKHYKKAMKLKPGYIDAMKDLANLYFKMNRQPEAETLLERVLRLDPKDTEAQLILANAKRSHPAP
jgi:tetratricopeptide (TPR) repeat protein